MGTISCIIQSLKYVVLGFDNKLNNIFNRIRLTTCPNNIWIWELDHENVQNAQIIAIRPLQLKCGRQRSQ